MADGVVIVVFGLGVAVCLVPIRGGDLLRFGDLRLRLVGAAVTAMAAQVVLLEVVDERVSATTGAVLHTVSFLPALAFVWANRSLPGLRLAVVGAAMNLAVVVANGGVMPSSAAPETAGSVRNSAAMEDPALEPLSDVLALPVPGVWGAAFSPGDLLLVSGGALALHRVCVGPRARPYGREAEPVRQHPSAGGCGRRSP